MKETGGINGNYNFVLKSNNGNFNKRGNEMNLSKVNQALIAAPLQCYEEMHGNVIGILRRGDKILHRFTTHNIITDDGDIYYAQRGAVETPTEAFDTMEFGTAGASPIKTSKRGTNGISAFVSTSDQLVASTYPKTNDTGDSDNTGDAIDSVSWLFSYGTGVGNDAAIDRAIIKVAADVAAGDPVLSYFTFAAFEKTASDTLKFFVNHNFLGA